MTDRAAVVDTLRDERLRRLVSYWFDIRGDDAVPRRQRVDPVEIPYALSLVWLCDHLPAEQRFRYRLIGQQVRDIYAGPVVGRSLDVITDGSVLPRVSDYFQRCVQLPAVVTVTGKIYSELARPARGERVLLPLAGDGRTVDGILGATAAHWDNVQPDGSLAVPDQVRTFFPLAGGAPVVER